MNVLNIQGNKILYGKRIQGIEVNKEHGVDIVYNLSVSILED